MNQTGGVKMPKTMQCENADECPVDDCAARERHEHSEDCEHPCLDVNLNEVYCVEVE